ncbi:hypothetical protein B5G16_00685 [Alistipes sp. An66]|nr:hypothetical protein B5G16_00685 [Alistipes sp. An66]
MTASSFFMSIFISIYIVTSFPLGVRDKGVNGHFKSQIFNAKIIDKIFTNHKKGLNPLSVASFYFFQFFVPFETNLLGLRIYNRSNYFIFAKYFIR